MTRRRNTGVRDARTGTCNGLVDSRVLALVGVVDFIASAGILQLLVSAAIATPGRVVFFLLAATWAPSRVVTLRHTGAVNFSVYALLVETLCWSPAGVGLNLTLLIEISVPRN